MYYLIYVCYIIYINYIYINRYIYNTIYKYMYSQGRGEKKGGGKRRVPPPTNFHHFLNFIGKYLHFHSNFSHEQNQELHMKINSFHRKRCFLSRNLYNYQPKTRRGYRLSFSSSSLILKKCLIH